MWWSLPRTLQTLPRWLHTFYWTGPVDSLIRFGSLLHLPRMKLDVYTVDAFTSKPFSGNPAAVVPTLQALDEQILQQLAGEINLSETAYVIPLEEGEKPWEQCCRFSLRWFTPTNEVNLCGHATLATAHVLFNCLGNTKNNIEFETRSGVLLARRNGKLITLDFPANPPEPLSFIEEEVLESLCHKIASELKKVSEFLISRTAKKLLVRIHLYSREELEALQIDAGELQKKHDGSVVKGVIFTVEGGLADDTHSQDETNYHCFSRYFAPWNGIPEDPVTGSAHTVLGPYWAKELGLSSLKCRQVSPRGGDVTVTVRDDGRVDLTGEATLMLQGHITL